MKQHARAAVAALFLTTSLFSARLAKADGALEVSSLSRAPALACLAGNEDAEATERAEALAGCNPIGKLPYFSQWAGPWGNKPLGDLPLCEGEDAKKQAESDDATCCMPYSAAGCGPTSLAMVLRAYGEKVTPFTVGELAVKEGLRRCNVDGINPASIILTRKFRGYVVDSSLDGPVDPPPREGPAAEARLDRLEGALKLGRPVILGCAGCTVANEKGVKRTFGGHFMVLSGVNDDGSYALLDPSGFEAKSISRDEVKQHARLIYVRRADGQPVEACRR